MDVTRVRHAGGSRVEPRLDPAWAESVKLEWEAAVVAYDTGLPVSTSPAESRAWIRGRWVDEHGLYNISVGTATSGPHSYRSACDYLHGVHLGATQQARRAISEV